MRPSVMEGSADEWVVARCSQCGWKKRVRSFAGYGVLCADCFFSRTRTQKWIQTYRQTHAKERALGIDKAIDEEAVRLTRQAREQRVLVVVASIFLFLVLCMFVYFITVLLSKGYVDVPLPG